MKVDYTQLSCYMDCPQKYYCRYVKKLDKIKFDERDIDKNFGKCVHDGLELFYKGEDDLVKLQECFKDFQDLPEEKFKTKANGIKLLEEYLKHYKDFDRKEYEVLETEIKDTFNIDESIIFTVKIDTIIRYKNNIYGLEHKTTKNITYNYFDRYTPNMQISGYSDYIRHKYGMCSGIILNALQSGYRQRAYRGEPAGFHCAFQREIINRTNKQLDDFRHQVRTWHERLVKSFESNIWGKNESSCHKYRGCQFKELCMTSKDIELDEQILESMYQECKPLEYLM